MKTPAQLKAERVAARREERSTERSINKMIEGAVKEVAANPAVPAVTAANAPVIADAVKEQVTPVLVNATNSEQPVQSRILWGATIASFATIIPLSISTLHSLGYLTDVSITAEQVTQVGGALVTLGGVAYVFYGRLKKGLRPLFWKGVSK